MNKESLLYFSLGLLCFVEMINIGLHDNSILESWFSHPIVTTIVNQHEESVAKPICPYPSDYNFNQTACKPQYLDNKGSIVGSWILVGTVAPENTNLIDDSIDLGSTTLGPTAFNWTGDFIAETHIEWLDHMFWNYNVQGNVCFIANEITKTSTDYGNCDE